MKKITLSIAVISSLFLVAPLDAKSPKKQEFKKEKIIAKNTIKSLTSKLKKQMKKAMEKGWSCKCCRVLFSKSW